MDCCPSCAAQAVQHCSYSRTQGSHPASLPDPEGRSTQSTGTPATIDGYRAADLRCEGVRSLEVSAGFRASGCTTQHTRSVAGPTAEYGAVHVGDGLRTAEAG